ncbi:MAG: DivIVA domain-containing protein [Acutalibacter sp.]
MLTVKEINEVSFGKASFSGYKAEDVDNFIDEVVESFTQLQAERDDALQQNAQLSDQLNEVNGQINELKSKNAELQKKLGILAKLNLPGGRGRHQGGNPQRPTHCKRVYQRGPGQGGGHGGRRGRERQAHPGQRPG